MENTKQIYKQGEITCAITTKKIQRRLKKKSNRKHIAIHFTYRIGALAAYGSGLWISALPKSRTMETGPYEV